MSGPRLFPDYAAAPTATERAHARWTNTRNQLAMFNNDPDPDPFCDVCAGTHYTADCPHGEALPIPGIKETP